MFQRVPTIEAVLMCTHNLCFEQKYANIKKNQLKIVIFTAVKNRFMLNRHVFVMDECVAKQTNKCARLLERASYQKRTEQKFFMI